MIIFLLLPFISTLMIVLNVYNGDVLGIDNNLEYIIWYIPSLIYYIYKEGVIPGLYNSHIALLGIILNTFWYFESPYKTASHIRHRTEYYDTQSLLCCLLYHTIYEKIYLRNN